MVNPNDRRVTLSDTISAATRRAGPIIRPAAFSVTLVGSLLNVPSGLARQIIDFGSDDSNSVSRP
ncbi:MAG: hypothetical protein GKR91_12635 [Pseudomonadales bacterium]|nr:hypothetical protein [Pseudomonadales bacterium]